MERKKRKERQVLSAMEPGELRVEGKKKRTTCGDGKISMSFRRGGKRKNRETRKDEGDGT